MRPANGVEVNNGPRYFYVTTAQKLPFFKRVTPAQITAKTTTIGGKNGIQIDCKSTIQGAYQAAKNIASSIPSGNNILLDGSDTDCDLGAYRALVQAGFGKRILTGGLGGTPDGLQQLRTNPNWLCEGALFLQNWAPYVLTEAVAIANGVLSRRLLASGSPGDAHEGDGEPLLQGKQREAAAGARCAKQVPREVQDPSEVRQGRRPERLITKPCSAAARRRSTFPAEGDEMLTEATRSTETHRARIAPIIDEFALRAAVASSYQAVSYFAGTHIMTQVVVPDRLGFFIGFDDGEAALLVCNLETSMVRAQTDIADINEYVEFADVPAETLVALLRERGITSGRIGIETRRLHADAYERIRAGLPDVEFVSIDDSVEAAQAVKDESECEMLRFAAQSTLDAVEAAVASTKVGDSELEMCAEIASRMMKSGGLLAFMVFGTAERALQAHGEAIDTPFREGDIWRIDLGARFFDVIYSDLARVGVVGEPTEEQQDILRRLRACQDAGFNAMEPGRPASEVFAAVKAEFANQDLPFFMPHIGHGLGIGLHEFPMLEPKNHAPLEAGMVLERRAHGAVAGPARVLPHRGPCGRDAGRPSPSHEAAGRADRDRCLMASEITPESSIRSPPLRTSRAGGRPRAIGGNTP